LTEPGQLICCQAKYERRKVLVKLLARGVYFEIKFVVNKNAKILTTSKKNTKKNKKKIGKGYPLCVVFCGRWAIACCLNASAYLNENPQGPHKYVCMFGSMLCKNLLLWSKIFSPAQTAYQAKSISI